MSGANLIDRWRAGQSVNLFSRAECTALADHLVQRNYAVYSDPKHLDHAALSAEVVELRQRASPGNLGADGALA